MGRGIRVSLPYINRFHDRHGKLRHYFRRAGFAPVALPGAPGSAEFMAAYNLAMVGLRAEGIGAERSLSGTLSAAIADYYRHGSFRALAPSTQKMRRAILERLRAEHGEKRIAAIEARHIAQALGAMRPFAARNWLKTLRGLMAFAVMTGLRRQDPTAGIRPVKAKPGSHHTWTEAEIAQFERAHPVGTRARLGMALMLYTAARRGDAVRLGPQHVRNGWLRYRQQKTGRWVEMPVDPELAAILAASPTGHLTFLVTAAGASFTAAGFGNLFRRWCNEAGIPHCSAHGLRKAEYRRLAEAGATALQAGAVGGHATLSEISRYTAEADRAKLAQAAIEALSRARTRKPAGEKKR